MQSNLDELVPMSRSPSFRNLWALTVLCLLFERPMHPYEMQRLIRQRKKDDFLDLKRGSLYHAIGKLQRAGLIEAIAVTREGKRPERTTYRITTEGSEELVAWLRELLTNTARETSHFFAALSFIPVLSPADALQQLQDRAGLLATEIAEMERVLQSLLPKIGRVVLLELEYSLVLRRAELAWLNGVTEDLRMERLTWSSESMRQLTAIAESMTGHCDPRRSPGSD
jgi:DNA-binding PadR family transcriptional regulator